MSHVSLYPGSIVDLKGGLALPGKTGVLSAHDTDAVTASSIVNHDVLVGGSSQNIVSVGPGSSGQVLQSRGANADPSYSTATYPTTAGTSGNILVSDGTNFISSAASAAYTSGSWTPGISVSGSTTGITYSTRSGWYHKVGNLVTVGFYMTISSIGILVGNVMLTGLPFAQGATANMNFNPVSLASSITGGFSVYLYGVANTSTMGFYRGNTGSQLTNLLLVLPATYGATLSYMIG